MSDKLETNLTLNQENEKQHISKPAWLKVEKAKGDTLFEVKRKLRKGTQFTVCEEARCPNICECWNTGTATFMILGDVCTRGCRFCNVKTGNPGGIVDSLEPLKLAETIMNMEIDYAVITMVDRDDLPDGGAEHICKVVEEINKLPKKVLIEILAGDFRGNEAAIKNVVFAGKGIDVFAHNLETVTRLTPKVRDAKANYTQSLQVLAYAKSLRPHNMYTKSGLMLGLGETESEIKQCLQDMRDVGVDIVTLGQYLQPSAKHLKVERYVEPQEFKNFELFAKEIGFLAVASGPLVRSSFKAANLFKGHIEE